MARRSLNRSTPATIAPREEALPVEPTWLRPAILALAALVLMAWFSVDVSDPDTWWHLKTGQFILQNHTLPAPDQFAFTTYLKKSSYAGEEVTRYFNLTHEWLAQAFLYLTYAAGGYAGLVLMRSLLLTAFCGIVGLVAHRRSGSFHLAVAAALAAGTVAWQVRTDRPQLITFVFLAATVAILEYRRWLWVLPPMFLIWANCHGGFFVGWLALFAYAAEALFLRFRGKPVPGDRQIWLVTAASVLVSGLNPNWFHVIPVMVSYRYSVMQASLWEWQYPAPWPPSPFSIMLAAALVVMVWMRRRTRPVDWLLLFGFGTLSVMAVRNIVLAGLVCPFLIAAYLPWKKKVPLFAEFLVAVLLLVGAGVRIVQGRAFQFHAADWKYAPGAADFLLQHHISGRMFNTYELGGYLIWRLWPQEKVFIDGRALNEAVFLDYQRMAYNADTTNGKSGEELLKEYGIEVIVMDGFEYTSGQIYLLPAALSDPKQTEWKLVYQDDQAVIYMRHPPPDVPVLNSFDALAAMESQCRLHLENDPGHPLCAKSLMQLFARIGDTVRARRWAAISAKYPE
ncbi:MAG TPA: hypothetical protein VGH38_37005 [Bryobacteraceae bacterium]|jgi:hypothetical protein